MIYIIGLIIASVLGKWILGSDSRDEKTIAKEILKPMLDGLEKDMSSKASGVLSQMERNIASHLNIVPEELREDLNAFIQRGFSPLHKVLQKNSNTHHVTGFNDSDAVIVITPDTLQPFQLSGSMAQECQRIIAGKTSDYEKALAIFEWFEQNIDYDHSAAAAIDAGYKGYRNSKQVFDERKGICGEMAFLFVVMAWYSGIKSASFVQVTVDHHGKQVAHACAAFKNGNSLILVDPAYHTFDVQHQQYEVFDYAKTVNAFKSWN